MKYLFIALLLTSSLAVAQKKNKVIYNFQTDYYWDNTLYKSEMAFYYDLKNGVINEAHYPVKVYQYTNLKQDSTWRKRTDVYYDDRTSYHSYWYKKIKDSLALVFFNAATKKEEVHVNYILRAGDSVSGILDGAELKDGHAFTPYVGGISKYLGQRALMIAGKVKQTYCLEEKHRNLDADVSYYYITEVYIDTASLTPVLFIKRRYNRNDVYTNYFSITRVKSVTNVLPSYAYQEDLILYENKILKWTAKQKAAFLNHYPFNNAKMRPYMECLLTLLDGSVSFYNWESSRQFKNIASHSKCNSLIPEE
ncbi:hypothetical protein HNQ91_001803 [Filimonas zeae]|uniref:hypothetical protein n=1 Tax=Filimonas zeae TaxID=1737353 RepID=UPI0016648D8C|nr:hypothetical protein [Filimonas zeae]MDR6338752.1 hypothetical protein [Filimonas zeae]